MSEAKRPTIEFDLEPFHLPNFLRISTGADHTISVGTLSDEQAAEYWDAMRAEWLAHVSRRRKAKEEKHGD